MMLWGAICGAILGYLFTPNADGAGFILGIIVGAFLASKMQKAMLKEIHDAVVKELALQLDNKSIVMSPVESKVKTEISIVKQTADLVPKPVTNKPNVSDIPVNHPDYKEIISDLALNGTVKNVHSGVNYFPEVKIKTASKIKPEIQVASEPDFLTRAFGAARNWLFGGNTVVRMGVLVLFVGLAFLAKYAIDKSMLPPELRLAAIGAVGVGLFVFGWKLFRSQPDRLNYALTLQGAGVGVLYLTVFAAFRLYQFLPSGAAFIVLGLICAFSTAIALLQNAKIMAFIGFAGAFAAPILLSTGQGSHIGLFSYYLLLSSAIVVVAWMRAWRELNLLGFFATFGVATLWGVLKYQPEHLSSTEPFLIAFFALYLAASLMYATRHGLVPKQAVDATMIFGLPIVAFGLQAKLMHDIEYATAFSSLILGAIYLALGSWSLKRKDVKIGQWLAECFVGLGIGFVTLAVPLALDARWTTAAWAVEGAAVYWMGQRQERWLARLTGMALQLFAALSFIHYFVISRQAQVLELPLVNPTFIGAMFLTLSALAIAYWSRKAQFISGSIWAKKSVEIENTLSPILFWAGFLWFQFAFGYEIGRSQSRDDGELIPILSDVVQTNFKMIIWIGSAWVAHRFALNTQKQPWSIAATPAWFTLPIMILVAISGILDYHNLFKSFGWLIWPAALFTHFYILKHLDKMVPQRWWELVHSGGVWLVILLIGDLLVWTVKQANLRGTAWSSVILLISSVIVLLMLTKKSLYTSKSTIRTHWPLDRFAKNYLWNATLPLVIAVALGATFVAITSNGNAKPLPYIPLFNPTDLTVSLALAACALWFIRIRQSDFEVPKTVLNVRWTLALASLSFIAINTMWLRAAHQLAGIRWNAHSLYSSFMVQTGYSILWTILATVLMLVAHRRHARPIWIGGAALLGLTVAKLFLVDLSNQGGSERIIAFIAVGVLMLVVGYFAPIPPTVATTAIDSDKVSG